MVLEIVPVPLLDDVLVDVRRVEFDIVAKVREVRPLDPVLVSEDVTANEPSI